MEAFRFPRLVVVAETGIAGQLEGDDIGHRGWREGCHTPGQAGVADAPPFDADIGSGALGKRCDVVAEAGSRQTELPAAQ